MKDIGADAVAVRTWFKEKKNTTYTSVTVDIPDAGAWIATVQDWMRRCYLTDQVLDARSQEAGVPKSMVINSKLPDPSAVMSGDFGEILTYFYQTLDLSKASTTVEVIGPKKWRLKEARTKAAPYSDVVQFVVPSWPQSSAEDQLFCAEVKTK